MLCHLDEHISVFLIPSDTAEIFNPPFPGHAVRLHGLLYRVAAETAAGAARPLVPSGTMHAIALPVADGLQQCHRGMGEVWRPR